MVSVLLAIALSGDAQAADLYVCAIPPTCSLDAECLANPGDCYPTVQAAIDAAADYDTIHLSDETYLEEIDNNAGPDNLTLQGAGVGLTTLMGTIDNNAIDFKNVTSTWRDLSITSDGLSRHCLLLDGGFATMENIEVYGCIRGHGAGIDVTADAQVTITDAVFRDNTTDGNGQGGSHLNMHSGVVTVINSTFTNGNVVSDGNATGGAILVQGGDLKLLGCTFTSNTSTGNGGAIGMDSGGDLEIISSTFTANASSDVGGAINISGSMLTIDNSLFEANASPFHGGAIHCDNLTRCSISTSTFTDNNSDYGGAVAVQSTEDTPIDNNVFCGNNGAGGGSEGGAILSSASSIDLHNNAFIENVSNNQGGALYSTDSSSIVSTNNTWAGNFSTNTGGDLDRRHRAVLGQRPVPGQQRSERGRVPDRRQPDRRLRAVLRQHGG